MFEITTVKIFAFWILRAKFSLTLFRTYLLIPLISYMIFSFSSGMLLGLSLNTIFEITTSKKIWSAKFRSVGGHSISMRSPATGFLIRITAQSGQLPKNIFFSRQANTKKFRLIGTNSTNWFRNWCSHNRKFTLLKTNSNILDKGKTKYINRVYWLIVFCKSQFTRHYDQCFTDSSKNYANNKAHSMGMSGLNSGGASPLKEGVQREVKF